jgi:hypothetical protein
MQLALNMAKMAKVRFLRTAIYKLQLLNKKPQITVCEAKN